MVKAVEKRMRGAPEPGAPAPATGHSPRILFPTAFPIDFLRFEVHFSCSVWVLRRDSISAHVWYGLRTNLSFGVFLRNCNQHKKILFSFFCHFCLSTDFYAVLARKPTMGSLGKFVRSPYQTCAEMLSLLRTHTEPLK